MWPESFSVSTANLVKEFSTIPEILIFPQGIIFWRALYFVPRRFEFFAKLFYHSFINHHANISATAALPVVYRKTLFWCLMTITAHAQVLYSFQFRRRVPDSVWILRPHHSYVYRPISRRLTSSTRRKSFELVLDTRSNTASDMVVLKPNAMASRRVSRLSLSLNLRLMMPPPRSPNLYAMLSETSSSPQLQGRLINADTSIDTGLQLFYDSVCLTLWRPLLPYRYSCKAKSIMCQTRLSRHYFVIFDSRALWRSELSVRVPGC